MFLESGEIMANDSEKLFTSAGTDINEVKRKNAASGMSYKEVLEMLVQKNQYPKNNIEEFSKEINPQKFDNK